MIPDLHAHIYRFEATLAALGGKALVALLGDFIDASHRNKPLNDAVLLTRVRQSIMVGLSL